MTLRQKQWMLLLFLLVGLLLLLLYPEMWGKGIRAGAVFWSGHPAADMDALPFVRHAFRKIPRRLL